PRPRLGPARGAAPPRRRGRVGLRAAAPARRDRRRDDRGAERAAGRAARGCRAAPPARVHAGGDRRDAGSAAGNRELAPAARPRPAARDGGGRVEPGGAAMRRDVLGEALREAPIPIPADAEERGRRIVAAAFAERESGDPSARSELRGAMTPQSSERRRRRPMPRLALGFSLVTLLAALLLSPAGADVRGWVGDAFT